MIDQKTIVPIIQKLAFNKLHEDWSEELKSLGIWHQFSKLYDAQNIIKSNITISFIVCAFNGYSDMVHLHKDRVENKREILLNLGANENDVEQGLFNQIIYNGANNSFADDTTPKEDNTYLESYLECVRWYMNWQKDSKWNMWVKKKEFVSVNIDYANKPPSPYKEVITKMGAETVETPDTDVSAIKVRKSQLLMRCSAIEDEINKIESEIKMRYSDLETISAQEDMLSGKDMNFFRLEDRLFNKQKNK
jgi:hypothetical protein